MLMKTARLSVHQFGFAGLGLALLLTIGACASGTGGGPGAAGTTGSGGGGGTLSCSGTQMACNGSCIDTSADSNNCGGCGIPCLGGHVCQSSVCVCGSGTMECNGSCVASDATHCGTCTNVCQSGQLCSGGQCTSMCAGTTCGTACCTGTQVCMNNACVEPTGTGGTTGGGGVGGGAAGTSGTAGRGGTTGAGGAGNVAGVLDGVMMTGPCLRDTEPSVCATVSGNCPNTGISDIALRGVLTTDKTVTLGGDPATTYTIVLHVQGEVESKNYTNGTDQNSSLTSPRADGWRGHNGGANPVPQTNNAYNVYMLRVTDPGATARDFFLNSLEPPGVENHTTYGIDYTTPAAGSPGALTAKGGATIRVVAADSNCSMIKNCGPSVSGSTCLSPIILQNIEPTAVSKNPSFNFSNAYNGQWIVLTVKSVTP